MDPVSCKQGRVKFECAQDANYLDVPRAATLEVLYVESSDEPDQGWLYARYKKRKSACKWGFQEIEGWIGARNVTREKITVLAFGLQGTEPELTEKESTGQHWQETDLAEAVRRRGHSHVDLFVDCRMFDDPQRRRDHPGMHPDLLAGITQHDDFPLFIRRLRSDWHERLQERRRQEDGSSHKLQEFTVAFFCAWGKHRSVACANCFQCILTTEGFLADTVYLCFDRWGRTKCRGECDACAGSSETKVNALMQAVKCWGSSFPCDKSLEMFISRHVCLR